MATMRNASTADCQFSINETLSLSDREWLITKLETALRVRIARFAYPEIHHLQIVYEREHFSQSTLLDALTRYRVNAKVLTRTAPTIERVLVAIDADGLSDRTIEYVGRIAAGHDNLHLCLYSRLPGLPPEIGEHGGAENANREQLLDNKQSDDIIRWREQKRREAQPALEDARDALLSAGVFKDAIELESSWDASLGESLAEALKRVARATGCRTIVVARSHLSKLQELVHHHTADALVHAGNGMTLWIVD